MHWHYRCATCSATYEILPGRYLCDQCARRQQPDRPLEGILEAEWDGDAPSSGIPLPIEPAWFPPIPVGNTPLWAPERLRRDFAAPKLPRNGLHALTKLKRYDGQAVTISDAEILAAQRTLSAGSGLFAEPSSSAAFAGWLKVRNRIAAEENCVVLITGSGLKDIKSAAQGLGLNT